jgi:hypothetical protein
VRTWPGTPQAWTHFHGWPAAGLNASIGSVLGAGHRASADFTGSVESAAGVGCGAAVLGWALVSVTVAVGCVGAEVVVAQAVRLTAARTAAAAKIAVIAMI